MRLAGSLWAKIAGEENPRINPRHGGGPDCPVGVGPGDAGAVTRVTAGDGVGALRPGSGVGILSISVTLHTSGWRKLKLLLHFTIVTRSGWRVGGKN